MVWFNGGSRETDSNLAPVDELVLFLMYLSAGLEPFHLAHSFMISDSAVERIIATWTHFLYSLLGSLPVWLPPEEVKGQLPPEFSSYPDTQVVLHCVEIRCERPPSTYPPSGFMIYSPFQFDQSFRALIGIAPHGAVTYVSRLYGSWCSDRDVFKRSGIADYLSEDAAVMFSEGFYLVDGLCPGKVHRPVMPAISEQMTEEELEPAREMGRLRYHIDRSKYRVLENRLLEGIIPLTMSKRIDQLFAIACLLVNFQHGPLTKTWNTSDFD